MQKVNVPHNAIAKLFVLIAFVLTVTGCSSSSSGGSATNSAPFTVEISSVDTVTPGHNVSLHAKVGSSAEGDIDLSWQQVSGTTVTLSYSTDNGIATFNAPSISTSEDLEFELTVNAQNGEVHVTKRIIANPDPSIISANAGNDVISQTGNTVSLHGIATTGASFSWEQISGPAVVNLSGATTDNPSFEAPAITTDDEIVFELTATNNGSSARDTVMVTIANPNTDGSERALSLLLTTVHAPLSLVVPDAQSVLKEADVQFSATAFGGSTNLSWDWSLVSTTPAATAPTINNGSDSTPHLQLTTPAISGADVTYIYEVTVEDDEGQIETGSVALYVGESTAPSIPFTLNARDIYIVEGDYSSAAKLTATVSVVGGNAPYTYQWTQTGAILTLENTDTATVKFAMPSVTQDQDIVLQVSVTDSASTPVTLNKTVTVHLIDRHVNRSPTQSLSVGQLSDITIAPSALTQVSANATGGDGNYNYAWQQLSGASATLANENTQTLSITAASTGTTETLRMQLKVTDGAAGEQTQTFLVKVDPSLASLTAATLPDVHADEGQSNITLTAIATGGSGTYTYSWQYVAPTSGADLNLSIADADKAVAHFNAPVVSQDTRADFEVSINDGTDTIKETVGVLIHNFTAIQAHALNTQAVKKGDTVHLQGAAAAGGKPPYTYAWTQTQGTPPITFADANVLNPSFTAPNVSQNTDFEFELTVTDAVGNTNQVREAVHVIDDMVVSLTVPASMEAKTSVDVSASISTSITGGLAPFTYSYSMNPAVDRGRLRIDSDDTDNPTLVRPSGVVGGDTTTITVTITDALGSITSSQPQSISVGVAAIQGSADNYVPANYDGQHETFLTCTDTKTGSVADECSDLDLILGASSRCPANKPFPYISLTQSADDSIQTTQYGCTTYSSCQTTFAVLNDPRELCASPDILFHNSGTGNRGAFSCKVCCDADSCNSSWNEAMTIKPVSN